MLSLGVAAVDFGGLASAAKALLKKGIEKLGAKLGLDSIGDAVAEGIRRPSFLAAISLGQDRGRMNLEIQHGLVSFDGLSVRYDARYLRANEFAPILREWIRRLFAYNGSEMIYLPFGIDDESIAAFEVSGPPEVMSLRVVSLDNLGFVPGVDSWCESMFHEMPVIDRRTQVFLVCTKDALLSAVDRCLKSAEATEGQGGTST
ncbi:hypothetical protein [Sorangium sp. So ce513]|uniref:hypothetical protein n=1 Tax=Sorangium sp. So ce513 TaxID=3133315 RepID=UPI003F5DCFB0